MSHTPIFFLGENWAMKFKRQLKECMMKRLVLLATLIVMVVALAACGGGGEENNAPAPVSFTVKGYDEFRYDPKDLTVPTGAQVTVTLENVGVLEHSWILVTSDKDPAVVSIADALGGATTGRVAGGQSNTVTFTAPPAGTYQIVCEVPGHAVGGMVGAFTVTP